MRDYNLTAEGLETYAPDYDVFEAYDRAMVRSLQVPLAVPVRYTRLDLKTKSVDDLRKIAAERGAFAESDDRALLTNAIINTQRIPVVVASADNAFGDPEYVAGIKAINPDMAVTQFYPIISIRRFPHNDNPLFGNWSSRRKMAWTTDGNAVLQSKPPISVVIPYQMDVFMLNMKHANRVVTHFARLFWGPLRIMVDLGPPWGVKPVFLTQTASANDTSQLEAPGTKAEKLIRYTYSLALEAWIPQATTLVKTVQGVRYTFTDETLPDDPEDLAVLDVPVEPVLID